MLALVIGNTAHNRVRNHPLLPAANAKQALEEVKRLTRLHLSTRGAFDFELEGTVPVMIAFLGSGSVGENRMSLERGRDRDYDNVLGKAGVLAAYTVSDEVGASEEDMMDFSEWMLSALSDHIEINEGQEPDGAWIIHLEDVNTDYIERCVFTSPAAQYWQAPEGYWIQGNDPHNAGSDLDVSGDVDLDNDTGHVAAAVDHAPIGGEDAQPVSDTLRPVEVQTTVTTTEEVKAMHTTNEAMSALRKNANTLIEMGLISDAMGINSRLSEVKVLNTVAGMLDLEPSMAAYIRANAQAIADQFKAISMLVAEQAADLQSDQNVDTIIPVKNVSADPLSLREELESQVKPVSQGAAVQRRDDDGNVEIDEELVDVEEHDAEADLSNEFDAAEAEAELEGSDGSNLDPEVMHTNLHDLIVNEDASYVNDDNEGAVRDVLYGFVQDACAELTEAGEVDPATLMSDEDVTEAYNEGMSALIGLINDTELLHLVSEDLLTHTEDMLTVAYMGEEAPGDEQEEEHDAEGEHGDGDDYEVAEEDDGIDPGYAAVDMTRLSAVPSALVTIVPRLVVNVVLPSTGPLARLSNDTLRALNAIEGDDGNKHDLATGLTKSRNENSPNGFYRKPFNTLARTLSRLANATILVPMSAEDLANNQEAAVNFVADHVANIDVESALTNALGRLNALPADEDGNLIVGFSGEGEDGIPVDALMSLDKSIDLIDNGGSFNVELTVTLSFVAPGYRNLRESAALARSLIKMCATASNSTGLSIHPAITYTGADAYLTEDSSAAASVNEIVSAMFAEVLEFGNAPTNVYNSARMSSLRTATIDAAAYKVYLQNEEGEIIVATCGDDDVSERTMNALVDAATIGTFDPEGHALYALGGDNTITLFAITEEVEGDDDEQMEMGDDE